MVDILRFWIVRGLCSAEKDRTPWSVCYKEDDDEEENDDDEEEGEENITTIEMLMLMFLLNLAQTLCFWIQSGLTKLNFTGWNGNIFWSI